MRIVQFSKSTRHYGTRSKAIEAANKLLEQVDHGNVTVVINSEDVMVPCQHGGANRETRYSPVFLLRTNDQHLAQFIASRGFYVHG